MLLKTVINVFSRKGSFVENFLTFFLIPVVVLMISLSAGSRGAIPDYSGIVVALLLPACYLGVRALLCKRHKQAMNPMCRCIRCDYCIENLQPMNSNRDLVQCPECGTENISANALHQRGQHFENASIEAIHRRHVAARKSCQQLEHITSRLGMGGSLVLGLGFVILTVFRTNTLSMAIVGLLAPVIWALLLYWLTIKMREHIIVNVTKECRSAS